MLELKHIRKIYHTEERSFTALDDISLSFPSLQFVSILGPSGCGKTTLLNLIGTLDTYDKGQILYDGKELASFTPKEVDAYRNNQIGFIFQNCYLIPQLSAFENVKIALSVRDYSKEECDQLALDALKKVHMEEFKDKKPNQLSGGQQQKVAIARAIVTNPSYLLADEPTGALDSKSSQEVMALLKEISKTRLVIMVTHNDELATEYSDRIIKMKDGKIVEDTLLHETPSILEEKKEERASHLSLKMAFKLAFKNLFSRKGKTILSIVANSFGIIGIAFLLAINNGFKQYSYDLSSSSATSLPIVVSSYTQKTDQESFNKVNQSKDYPEESEIYPSVSLASQYAYSYNNITEKYLSFLDEMKEEKLVRDYTLSYSSSYSYNLTTHFPKSLSGEKDGYIKTVKTTINSYNSYASQSGLPYNIFHVLYGDLDQYDVLSGSLPKKDDEIVLVVNQYNAVSFQILKALGFYNENDTEQDVRDDQLKTKVKPISFSSVIGKEYKIFTNDEMYPEYTTMTVKDDLNHSRTIYQYQKAKLTEDFYATHGKTLKISGIIRPKKSSSFSILSPALCFTKELQDELMPENENSGISQDIKKNIVFSYNGNTEESKTNAFSSFLSEMNTVLNDYYKSGSSILPTEKLNAVFNKYFTYYPVIQSDVIYLGFSTFFSQAKNHGASLIDEDLKGVDLSKKENIEAQMKKIEKDFLINMDKAYDDIISLVAYSNAYSSIQCLVIFPMDLEAREEIMARMDEYNNIKNDSHHAASEKEQIYYTSADASRLLNDVSEMISLVSMILIIFSVISLVASSAMTSLLISNNVLERRKEIGLLRSLGSRKGDVILLFEIEALFNGILAGIVGSLFTYILCFPLNYYLKSYLTYYHIGNICNFTFNHALIVIAISFVIGFISALLPSFKASKVSPIDSLRSE